MLVIYSLRGSVESGDQPQILQHLNVRIISHKMCKAQLKKLGRNIICTQSQVGYGTCVGDSGGPLTKDNKLLGLISFYHDDQSGEDDNCGNGWPIGYVRVSKFIDWIKNKTKLQ
uniref:CSON007634 protein n=1 Tax=Culicoides sonorensis TaxID=179676 RepID=A0A336LAK8_CULSO